MEGLSIFCLCAEWNLSRSSERLFFGVSLIRLAPRSAKFELMFLRTRCCEGAITVVDISDIDLNVKVANLFLAAFPAYLALTEIFPKLKS